MLLVTATEKGAFSEESLARLAKAMIAQEGEKTEYPYGVLAISPLLDYRPAMKLLRKAMDAEWRRGEPKWAPRESVGVGATLIEKKAASPPRLLVLDMESLEEGLLDPHRYSSRFGGFLGKLGSEDSGSFVWILVKEGGELWVEKLLKAAKSPVSNLRQPCAATRLWMKSLWGATVLYTERPQAQFGGAVGARRGLSTNSKIERVNSRVNSSPRVESSRGLVEVLAARMPRWPFTNRSLDEELAPQLFPSSVDRIYTKTTYTAEFLIFWEGRVYVKYAKRSQLGEDRPTWCRALAPGIYGPKGQRGESLLRWDLKEDEEDEDKEAAQKLCCICQTPVTDQPIHVRYVCRGQKREGGVDTVTVCIFCEDRKSWCVVARKYIKCRLASYFPLGYLSARVRRDRVGWDGEKLPCEYRAAEPEIKKIAEGHDVVQLIPEKGVPIYLCLQAWPRERKSGKEGRIVVMPPPPGLYSTRAQAGAAKPLQFVDFHGGWIMPATSAATGQPELPRE
jgi:hypothetical protein